MNEGQLLYQVLKPAPIQGVNNLNLVPVAGAMNLDSAFEAVRQAGLTNKPHCIVVMVCLKSTIGKQSSLLDLKTTTN